MIFHEADRGRSSYSGSGSIGWGRFKSGTSGMYIHVLMPLTRRKIFLPINARARSVTERGVLTAQNTRLRSIHVFTTVEIFLARPGSNGVFGHPRNRLLQLLARCIAADLCGIVFQKAGIFILLLKRKHARPSMYYVCTLHQYADAWKISTIGNRAL